MNCSLSLLREPFGRPAGLATCPGLNCVASLPPVFFPLLSGVCFLLMFVCSSAQCTELVGCCVAHSKTHPSKPHILSDTRDCSCLIFWLLNHTSSGALCGLRWLRGWKLAHGCVDRVFWVRVNPEAFDVVHFDARHVCDRDACVVRETRAFTSTLVAAEGSSLRVDGDEDAHLRFAFGEFTGPRMTTSSHMRRASSCVIPSDCATFGSLTAFR